MPSPYELYPTEEEIPQQGIVLKRALGRRTSAGDTLTNNVTPGRALPNSIDSYRNKAAELYSQGSELYNSEPDMTQLQEFAKQRGQQGDRSMLTALAAQFAGEGYAPLQEQMLKKAAASSEPMKFGAGMLSSEGRYIKDPFAAQDKKAEFLLQQAKAYETMAANAETARERIAAQRAQQETMTQLRMMGLNLQQQGLDMRRDALNNKAEPGNFTHEGYTPDNQRVVTNSKTGQSFILGLNPNGTPSYEPYNGPATPKSAFEKNVAAAQTFQSKADSSDALVKQIESNPDAFGITAAAVSKLPASIQGRVGARVLDENTLKLRADVLRQAAMEISDIYGAAQSVGEAARAATFIPAAEDPPQIVIEKLKAARDYARNNAKSLGGAVNQAARDRSGGAQSSGGGGLSSDESAELARLRAKHRRDTP
jgi:hypothetical protein